MLHFLSGFCRLLCAWSWCRLACLWPSKVVTSTNTAPYVPALFWQGPDELSVLALRTLEMWVDAFTPEIIEVALANVMPELMLALWALLKPSSPLGPKALLVRYHLASCLVSPPDVLPSQGLCHQT